MSETIPQEPSGGPGDNGNLPQADRRRTSLWLRVVLFVSLALNLAVAGIVAGFLIKGPPEGGPPPHAERVGGLLSTAMTEDERREVGRSVFMDMKNNRPDRAAIESEFAGIVSALRAEPFDKAAFSQSMQRQLEEAVRRQTAGQQILIDYIAEMSPAERQAYADRLESRLSHPPGRDRDQRDDRDAKGHAPKGAPGASPQRP